MKCVAKLIAGGLLAGLLCGCGRGQETVPVGPEAGPGQAAANPAAPAVPVRAAQASPSEAPRQSARPAASGRLDPSVDPDDVFEVVEGPEGFDIDEQMPGVSDDDLFAVVVPPSGVDSSHFTVAEPASRSRGRPDSGFRLPAGFAAIPEGGYSREGLPLRIRCEKDGATMVLVPAGTAVLGRKDGPSFASPPITVWLDDFYIDETEVTLEQFQKFLDAVRPTSGQRVRPDPLNAGGPPDHPALGLPWGEAQAFAAWSGRELPTEAQWEKTARGPKGFEHPWGDGRAVWSRERTLDDITAVASFRTDRSPYGVWDLAGNAREWCRDYFSERAFAEAAGRGGTLRNWEGPRSPSIPGARVVKGNGPGWVVWHRAGLSMRERAPDVGFRCVLAAKSPQSN